MNQRDSEACFYRRPGKAYASSLGPDWPPLPSGKLLRSSIGPRSPLLVAAVPAAAVLVAVLAACGSESSAEIGADGRSTAENAGGTNDTGQEPRPDELIGDASAPTADKYRGSPLCHVNATTCDPDDDGSKISNTSYAQKCAVQMAPDAGAITDPKGCRLTGATAAPACLDADARGNDGEKCESGADCAPGFDCVMSNEVGYCRRYCCSGSCGAHRSQAGAETFCDVQKLQGSGIKAPVCMPIKICALFTPGECADNETCTVVTDDGTTGCVANGTANVGEACDQEHCSAGLTCLGQAGNRSCFQLCRTKNGPGCGSNQICKPTPIFTDPTIGVCAAQ